MRRHVHLRDEPATVQAPAGCEISVSGGPWTTGPTQVRYGDSVTVRSRRETVAAEADEVISSGQLTALLIVCILTVPFALALLAWVVP
jgi:hypothetical protein